MTDDKIFASKNPESLEKSIDQKSELTRPQFIIMYNVFIYVGYVGIRDNSFVTMVYVGFI